MGSHAILKLVMLTIATAIMEEVTMATSSFAPSMYECDVPPTWDRSSGSAILTLDGNPSHYQPLAIYKGQCWASSLPRPRTRLRVA